MKQFAAQGKVQSHFSTNNFFLIPLKSFSVFTIDNNRIISMIKVRVIQAMIQIVRPTAWGVGRVRGLAMELNCIEIYVEKISR